MCMAHHTRQQAGGGALQGGFIVVVYASVQLRAANKTLLALLPDLAVLLVLSAVVRLARIAALGFVSRSKFGL